MIRSTTCFSMVLARAVGLVAIIAAGCGRPGPPVAYVYGIVLLDGKPVEGATIGFSPGERGRPAVGCTDAAGRFTLTSTGGGRPSAGAVVGDYSVVISKQIVETVAGTESPVNEAERPPESWSGGEPARPKPPSVTNVIPIAYGNASTSALTAKVVPGSNQFRFELNSRYEAKIVRE